MHRAWCLLRAVTALPPAWEATTLRQQQLPQEAHALAVAAVSEALPAAGFAAGVLRTPRCLLSRAGSSELWLWGLSLAQQCLPAHRRCCFCQKQTC